MFRFAKPAGQNGFTLIELLVVINIIQLIVSIVSVSAVNARRKARDTVRQHTLRQLQKALELYHQDNGRYPITVLEFTWYSSSPGDAAISAPDNYIPGLVPKYLAGLPKDPLGGNAVSSLPNCVLPWKRSYLYMADGQGRDYKLLSSCSLEAGTNLPSAMNDPVRDGGPNYDTAGTNFTTPPSDPNSPFNPRSCDDPPVPPASDVAGGDNKYVWSYSVYSSPRSRCW